VIGAGDDDPVRTYSLEEQAQLTEHLHAVTQRVHAGELRDRPLNIEVLCALHAALFSDVRDHAGRIRRSGFGSEYLTFGPNRSVHRDEVERSLNALFANVALELQAIADKREEEEYELVALRLAARTHAEIIWVHPFEDGNGRTSRLCAGHLLVKCGLLPIPMEAAKQEYTAALNYYFRTRDLDPLVALFVRLYAVGR